MSTFRVTNDGSGMLFLEGFAEVDEVGAIRDQLIAQVKALPLTEIELDISKLEARGTAGVALLIATLRDASREAKTIVFIHPSEHVHRVAVTCGVSEMLGFPLSPLV